MIDGAETRRELARDLLAWHALRSTPEYPRGATVRGVLGRAPAPLDPRWAKERAATTTREESGAQLAMEQARSEAAVKAGYGSMGQLSPEEAASLFAEAAAWDDDEAGS